MLSLKDVSKSYKKKTVLSGLSHDFSSGVTIITGQSGAGKSTLLRLCASAEKPSAGTVLWNGVSLYKKPKPFRRILGYAPQRIDFPEDITAMDFLRHIGALKGQSMAASTRQGGELLEQFGLGTDADNLIQTFSGGMRRRLGLSQAFLGQPQCLILDEPTAELDPETAGRVHDIIFAASKTAVVLMTTHLASSLGEYNYETYVVENRAG